MRAIVRRAAAPDACSMVCCLWPVGRFPSAAGRGSGTSVYLKRLELHGFKSFAPRTALEFSPGITAIVGPNGSGKCTSGDTLVTLADGREVEIRDLVEDALRRSLAIE